MMNNKIYSLSAKWCGPYSFRFYCDNKKIKQVIHDIIIEKDEKSKAPKQEQISIKDATDTYHFRKILKHVLLEKSKTANLQSGWTKACKTLLDLQLNTSNVETSLPSYTKFNIKSLKDQFLSVANLETHHLNQDKLKSTSLKRKKLKMKKISQILSEIDKNTSDNGNGPTFSRPIRQEPGKVILGFIPIEWWHAFIPKTGVTGFGTFLISVGTFLVSKEYYVLEHEFYTGLSMILVWYFGCKHLGPHVAKYLDKERDDYENSLNEAKQMEMKHMEELIAQEILLQYQNDGQLILAEVKRENVKLQLEEEYRKRQMYVYNKVMNILDYHVAVDFAKQRIQHKNLLHFVTKEVMKSVTPEMQDQLINYSIDNIVRNLDKSKKT